MNHGQDSDGLTYGPGLDRTEEAVISAHGMQDLARDTRLELYDDDQFAARAATITMEAVEEALIPLLLRACEAFCRDRAKAATARARQNYQAYGLDDPLEVGFAELITEVMFDRHFQRGPRQTCSRKALCVKVAEHVMEGRPIEMVIPALPFKLSSPLRTRGRLPDLADLNFLLELYEIAATIELIYRAARSDLSGRLARFTVVSDGTRFNRIVHERECAVYLYRESLKRWLRRLGLETYISLVDYRSLLQDLLPTAAQEVKAANAVRARLEYEALMWPIFDPYGLSAAMRTAARIEPDPESTNPDGRFVSLLKSLVFTVNYRSLDPLRSLPSPAFRRIYRDLTAHLFEPYALLSPADLENARVSSASAWFDATDAMKECLRQSMLREAWATAIDYLAEIKSDRELAEDPILTCLPGHFRWTIHGKPGQLAVATATAHGIRLQAWTGVAVFKRTRREEIKLCTLPVLAAEGVGATPVTVTGSDQPFFYLYPDIPYVDLDVFLGTLGDRLARGRAG